MISNKILVFQPSDYTSTANYVVLSTVILKKKRVKSSRRYFLERLKKKIKKGMRPLRVLIKNIFNKKQNKSKVRVKESNKTIFQLLFALSILIFSISGDFPLFFDSLDIYTPSSVFLIYPLEFLLIFSAGRLRFVIHN